MSKWADTLQSDQSNVSLKTKCSLSIVTHENTRKRAQKVAELEKRNRQCLFFARCFSSSSPSSARQSFGFPIQLIQTPLQACCWLQCQCQATPLLHWSGDSPHQRGQEAGGVILVAALEAALLAALLAAAQGETNKRLPLCLSVFQIKRHK